MSKKKELSVEELLKACHDTGLFKAIFDKLDELINKQLGKKETT